MHRREGRGPISTKSIFPSRGLSEVASCGGGKDREKNDERYFIQGASEVIDCGRVGGGMSENCGPAGNGGFFWGGLFVYRRSGSVDAD